MTLVSALTRRRASGTGSAETGARRTRLTTRWNLAMVALPSVAILVLGWHRRWISDDGLIFTRTVRQILAGHGPVFNTGERAEASTSTLWQWLLVVFGWVTQADVARLAVYLGLLCTAAGYAIALDATRRLHRPWSSNGLLLPGGVLVLLALPPVWDFATSGLETGLSTLWLGGCWWLTVRSLDDTRRRTTIGLAFAAGLGPMVRPDLTIATAGFLVVLWFTRRPRWTSALGLLAAAFALPAAYEVFRAGYYGVLLPLPALTKEASSTDWGRGGAYLTDFERPYLLWLPLLLLAALVSTAVVLHVRARRTDTAREPRAELARTAVVLMPVVCGMLMALYVVRVGGDFMHGRMLLPALFMLLLPVLLVPAGRLALPTVVAVAGWAVVCAAFLRVPYAGLSPNGIIADERAFYTSALGVRNPVTGSAYTGHYPRFPGAARLAMQAGRPVLVYAWYDGFYTTPLRPDLRTKVAAVWTNLGMNGAAIPLDGTSVDILGLAYPLAAHVQMTHRGRPGHEKELDIAWVFAEYADPSAVLPPGVDPLRVAAARYTLTCGSRNTGAIKELQDSVRKPLTWSRFWDNLTGSYDRTTFRFPNDPLEAIQKVCGVSTVPQDYLDSMDALAHHATTVTGPAPTS